MREIKNFYAVHVFKVLDRFDEISDIAASESKIGEFGKVLG